MAGAWVGFPCYSVSTSRAGWGRASTCAHDSCSGPFIKGIAYFGSSGQGKHKHTAESCECYTSSMCPPAWQPTLQNGAGGLAGRGGIAGGVMSRPATER